MYKLMLLAFLCFSLPLRCDNEESLSKGTYKDASQKLLQDYFCYVVRVQFPSSLKSVPTVCGYYKGYNLEFHTDLCIIQEVHPCDKFMIAITEQIQRKFDNKNVQYLERLPKSKCRLFYVTRTYDEAKPWTIEEELEKNVPSKL